MAQIRFLNYATKCNMYWQFHLRPDKDIERWTKFFSSCFKISIFRSVCGGGEVVHFENDYSASGDSYRACSLVGKRNRAHLASLFYFYNEWMNKDIFLLISLYL